MINAQYAALSNGEKQTSFQYSLILIVTLQILEIYNAEHEKNPHGQMQMARR